MLMVKNSPGKGRGVYATKFIERGTILFNEFGVRVPPDELEHINRTCLKDYYYEFEDGSVIIVFGIASLLNHGIPNVHRQWHETPEGWCICGWSCRDIQQGEELLHDYRFDDDKIPDWAK